MDPHAEIPIAVLVRAWLRRRLKQLGGDDLPEEEPVHTEPKKFADYADTPSSDAPPQEKMHNVVTMDGAVRRTMTGHVSTHPLASPDGGVTSTERIAAQLQRTWER